MSLNIQMNGRTITAYLGGEIDHHSSRDIRVAIDRMIDETQASLLIMDFADVTFMDSSGVGLVMGRYRKINAQDGTLQVTNTPPSIYKVMRIAGLDRLALIEKSSGKNLKKQK